MSEGPGLHFSIPLILEVPKLSVEDQIGNSFILIVGTKVRTISKTFHWNKHLFPSCCLLFKNSFPKDYSVITKL